METGLIALIVKLLALVNGMVSHLVAVLDTFMIRTPDGQWLVNNDAVLVTNKGYDVIGALATVIHQGAIFVAQFMTLLPAGAAGVTGPL